MTVIDTQLWERLAAEPPPAPQLRAKCVAEGARGKDLIVALDAKGQRHLLVPVLGGEEFHYEKSIRGIQVHISEFGPVGRDSSRFVDLVCVDPAGHGVFDVVGNEIAARIATGLEDRMDVVVRVLDKWVRFWSPVSRKLLSREQIVGLFAELWFLSREAIPVLGDTVALSSWRGPLGSPRDFECSAWACEVKGSVGTGVPFHRINGIDQLEVPSHGKLFLYSLRLSDEKEGDLCLPSLVTDCRALVAASTSTLETLNLLVAKAGYLDEDESEYAATRFRVIDSFLYAVSGDFPRLVRENLQNGVPNGVAHISYEICLAGFDHLRVSTNSLASA